MMLPMPTMKIKVENEVTVLSEILKEFFGDKMDLAMVKFFGLFISALCTILHKDIPECPHTQMHCQW
jgi:hypothetical protein